VSSPSVANSGVAIAGLGAGPADPKRAHGEYPRTKAEAELLAGIYAAGGVCGPSWSVPGAVARTAGAGVGEALDLGLAGRGDPVPGRAALHRTSVRPARVQGAPGLGP